VVLLAVDGVSAGAVGLTDAPRSEAADAVAQIKALGLEVAMVTGDHTATAQAIADSLGIEQFSAEMLPEDKLQQVRRTIEQNKCVAFVGDGINDAPALTGADVGIAFAAGTDVAVAAADLTLVRDDLLLIPQAVRIARKSVRIIKQNLFWAFFYNMCAIPLAATGRISPGLAAAAMMCSSISVVLNSLRLRERGTRQAD
jgi:Cu+-exporting ATPase